MKTCNINQSRKEVYYVQFNIHLSMEYNRIDNRHTIRKIRTKKNKEKKWKTIITKTVLSYIISNCRKNFHHFPLSVHIVSYCL